MHRTTTVRLATGAVTLGLVLAAGVALAGPGFRGGREGMPGRDLQAALATLDLTDDQKAKVREILEERRAKAGPLRLEGRAAREALRAAVDAASPDPAVVGAAFLRVDAHRKAVRAEVLASRERLEALLTAEQRAKLEGWREAHRQAHRAGAAAFGSRGSWRRGPRPPLD